MVTESMTEKVLCSVTVAKRSFFVNNFLFESCITWMVAGGMIGVSFRPLPALQCLYWEVYMRGQK